VGRPEMMQPVATLFAGVQFRRNTPLRVIAERYVFSSIEEIMTPLVSEHG